MTVEPIQRSEATMHQPNPGGQYRHYKGKDVTVLAISRLSEDIPDRHADMTATCDRGEQGKHLMPFWWTAFGHWAHRAEYLEQDGDRVLVPESVQPHVIYFCSNQMWARTLKSWNTPTADGQARFSQPPMFQNNTQE